MARHADTRSFMSTEHFLHKHVSVSSVRLVRYWWHIFWVIIYETCRPISVLPCFSKLLERIMCNRLFKYLSENSVLCEKQFGFQTSHSTQHATLLLVNQLYQSFVESKFTLGIFIDLSKAFDTANHKILTTNLELYGIKGCNIRWFESY